MNWKFWQRRRDNIDGYTPPEPPGGDPWKSPEVRQQIEARGSRSRMDAFALDGFANSLTGIGDWTRDKTFGGRMGGPDFTVTLLSGIECENRWRGSDLGGRIIETVPDEMTREGWEIQIQPGEEDEAKADGFPPGGGAPDDAAMGMPGMPPQAPKPPPLPNIDDETPAILEELNGKLEELDASEKFWQALCYERAYGGGAILLGAQDGEDDPAKPLDEENIGEVTFLNAFRGGWDGDLVAWSYYTDPNRPKYGLPEIYMLRNPGVPVVRVPAPGQAPDANRVVQSTAKLVSWVHESRLLVFGGTAVSHSARTQMRGWGDSVFTRVDRVLSQYDQTWGGVANLMTDFSQGVLKLDGLAQLLAGNNKSSTGDLLTARSRAIQVSRSIARLMLIDKTEEFSRETASLGGIAEILQQFALRLAAAANMPATLLMGQSPAGMNATGESDIRFFYDRVASWQRKRMAPQLRRLIKLIMLSQDGPTDGEEPARWRVTFCPLYQLTALEKADLRLKGSQADDIDIRNQVLTPEEVAASAYGGSEYSSNRVLDLEGRREMADEAKQAQDDAKVQAEDASKRSALNAMAAAAGEPTVEELEAGAVNPVAEEPDEEDAEPVDQETTDAGGWTEHLHPRAKGGRFGAGSGNSVKKGAEAAESGKQVRLKGSHEAKAEYHRAVAEHFRSAGKEELAAKSETKARNFTKKAAAEKIKLHSGSHEHKAEYYRAREEHFKAAGEHGLAEKSGKTAANFEKKAGKEAAAKGKESPAKAEAKQEKPAAKPEAEKPAPKAEAEKPKEEAKPAAKPPEEKPAAKSEETKPAEAAKPADGAKEFASSREGNEWGKKNYGKWSRNLNQNDKTAMKEYTGDGYSGMNSGLRGQHEMNPYEKRYVRDLQAALKKAPPVPETIKAYRGVQATGALQKKIESLKPGSSFSDSAFMSTSLNSGVAHGFAAKGDGDGTVFHITVPKGTRGAAYMAESSVKGEGELLFSHGRDMTVTKVEHTPHPSGKGTVRVIHVTMNDIKD